jgi:hypothetical protein
MRKVGDLEWRQLSQWEFAPKDSVQIFVKSLNGKHIFHFYLTKVAEITGVNSWRVEPVTSLKDVPEDIVNWRGSKAFIK